MKNLNYVIFALFMSFFISCGLKLFEDENETVKSEDTNIIEDTNVIEDTTMFKKDESDNSFVFETNDAKYLGQNGYTFWTTINTNNSDNFETVSAVLCKESGKNEAGFGIIFCSQDIEEKQFLLTVLINTNGLYTIGKFTDGSFSHINGSWKSSNYINKGNGIKNEIAISYEKTNKEFLLKINGKTVTNFTVSEEIIFKGSKSGYAVVIANNEKFPDVPVKVTFNNK